MVLLKTNITLHKQGMTIVEVTVVALIIAIFIAFAAPSFMTARLKAEEQKAVTTLNEFAKAQTAYWFDHAGTATDPNTYTSAISDLTPDYVDIPLDDGDWLYSVTGGDATSFTIIARHLDAFGGLDGLTLTIDKTGTITKGGTWPY